MSRLRRSSRRAPRGAPRLVLAGALIGLAALVLLAFAAPGSGLLTVLPSLALAALMLIRPYLGERVIARLRATCEHAARARVRACTCASRAQRPRRLIARGGRLIASALAGRAPPAVIAACG